jgi:hypothetical protein
MGLESGRYSAYGDDTHQPVETHAATILSLAFLYETDFTKLWHFFDNLQAPHGGKFPTQVYDRLILLEKNKLMSWAQSVLTGI